MLSLAEALACSRSESVNPSSNRRVLGVLTSRLNLYDPSAGSAGATPSLGGGREGAVEAPSRYAHGDSAQITEKSEASGSPTGAGMPSYSGAPLGG
jgi:hypothetical protein